MPEHTRLEELRRRVQRDPASIVFAQLAEEYRRAGQCRDAVETCQSGLEIHPGYLSARVTLARALVELGQIADAQAEFQTVLAAAPDNLAAIRGLADAHARLGEVGEALAFYRRALGLAPNDPDLDRIVNDLAREVARAQPVDEAELLTLEQLTRELERHASAQGGALARPMVSVPTTAAVADEATPDLLPTDPRQSSEDLAANAKLQTLARLEHWLAAIHGARAEPRA